jgi:mRNA interferase MazF
MTWLTAKAPFTIVAPITSQLLGPAFLTRILVLAGEGGLKVDSAVLLNHSRSIDQRRLIKRLGRLEPETMRKVDRGIQVIFGLMEI